MACYVFYIVLYDLSIGVVKLGVYIAVATLKGYEIPSRMRELIERSGSEANVLVTDTWVSMGQEAEAQKKMADFKGYQITPELAEKGQAKSDWRFMHCLPRHPEEVSDEVFYNPQRSLVFPEAVNRLWAAIAIWRLLWSIRVRSCESQAMRA